MMKSAILSHFHPDERVYVLKTAGEIDQVVDRHELRRTDFLDPRQAVIVETLVRRHQDLHVVFYGGYPEAERKRAIIAPDYMRLDPEDAGIKVIDIVSDDVRIADLDHGDYLGALLGLGMKRDKLGDLHVTQSGCQCIIAEEMASFVDLHLKQVHRVTVSTAIVPIDRLCPIIPKREELTFTAASMRLDAIIGDVWRLSRAKSLIPIKAGRCRVNWKVEEDPSCLLKEEDTVSLKGFGRFVLQSVQGETKKGRIRIIVSKFV